MTIPMALIKELYAQKASVSPALLYHSIAPSNAVLPFVTMRIKESEPIYCSAGVAYEPIQMEFTVVAETDTEVETYFDKVLTLCNATTIPTVYSIIRVAQRGKKVERIAMRSRDNKLVWVGVSQIDIWVCNAE